MTLTESELDWWEQELRSYLPKVPQVQNGIDQLVAAAREGLAGQWKPIETAPKDGTPILLWIPHVNGGPVIDVGFYKDDNNNGPFGPFCWRGVQDETGGWARDVVTHWMPLPNPPAPQARSERVCEHGVARGYYCSHCDNGSGISPTTDAAMQEREDKDGCDIAKQYLNNHSRDCADNTSADTALDPSVVSEGETAGAAARRLAKEELAMLRRVSQRVVSEGEPPPGLKCEPSGNVDRNGLQPQPSVGELIKRLEQRFARERNAWSSRSGDSGVYWCGLLSEAATVLKQQAENIADLEDSNTHWKAAWERAWDCSDDYKRLANDRKIQLLDAQDTINQWKETAEHATSQHAKSVQILQAEIERWNNMAQHNREAYDELEALVKRYREALQAHDKFWQMLLEHDVLWSEEGFQDWALEAGLLKIEPYDPDRHGPNDVDAEPGQDWYVPTDIARQALTDGEKE